MELIQAASLLKEIVEKCPALDGNNFLLMLPDIPEPLLSEGYEIVIKIDPASLNKEIRFILDDIARREKLIINQRSTSVMMYTPKPQRTS